MSPRQCHGGGEGRSAAARRAATSTPRASPPLPLLCSRFCTSLWMNRVNGMLCDAPGLGKTSVAIAYMTYLADRHRFKGPFLVVCADDSLKTWNDMLHWHAAGRGGAGRGNAKREPKRKKGKDKPKENKQKRHAPHLKRIEYHPYVDKYFNPVWNMRKPFDVIVTTMSMSRESARARRLP